MNLVHLIDFWKQYVGISNTFFYDLILLNADLTRCINQAVPYTSTKYSIQCSRFIIHLGKLRDFERRTWISLKQKRSVLVGKRFGVIDVNRMLIVPVTGHSSLSINEMKLFWTPNLGQEPENCASCLKKNQGVNRSVNGQITCVYVTLWRSAFIRTV